MASQLIDVSVSVSDLPCVLAAFASGELSWAQLIYVVRFATPETDASIAARAPGMSLNQLRALALDHEGPSPSPGEEVVPSFGWTRKSDHFALRGKVPLYEEAKLEAIARLADAEGIDELTGGYRAMEFRQGDALLAILSNEIASDANTDLATAQIHVDLDSLVDPSAHGWGWVGDNVVLLNTVKSMLCDSRYQLIPQRDGQAVGIGQLSRTIPYWAKRLLNDRDHGCRFPGCSNTRGRCWAELIWTI
jgi:hypothetical protein